jgi:hypothetical protein
MPHTPNATTKSGETMVYQIRIKGRLSSRWERWFERMTITPQADGDTILTGPIVDQAALHGVLTKIRDLGVLLISIERVDPAQHPNHREDTP